MVLIGTSGWNYQHWRGKFYPEQLSQRKWLEYFSTHFKTVELNSSFYHIPKESVTKSWFTRTPTSFSFSVKVTRLISHIHKLRECEDVIEWFFSSCRPLAPKIPVYLIQLPPSLCPDPETLTDFIPVLVEKAHKHTDNNPDKKSKLRFSMEIRNKKCDIEKIASILEEYNISLCLHDYGGKFNYTIGELPTDSGEKQTKNQQITPPQIPYITADFVYIRFHGYGKRYGGCYPEEFLREWAKQIKEWDSKGLDVFAYFNNDFEGYAIENARSLIGMVGV